MNFEIKMTRSDKYLLLWHVLTTRQRSSILFLSKHSISNTGSEQLHASICDILGEFSTKWLWVHGCLVFMYIYIHHTNAGLTTSVPHVNHFLHSNDAIHSQLSLIIFHLYSFMVVSSAAFVNNWMWSCGHKYHK